MLKKNGHQKERRGNGHRKPNGEPKPRRTRTQAPNQVLLTVAEGAPILDRHVWLPLVHIKGASSLAEAKHHRVEAKYLSPWIS